MSNRGSRETPYLVVLGTAQDGGYPQAGCRGACCARARSDPSLRRFAACVAVVEPSTGRRWLIDATPDLPSQLDLLQSVAPVDGAAPGLAGVFLTHGHIGHYTGLVHFGKEVMGATGLPVYAMPRMRSLLTAHQPWAALVSDGHVSVRLLEANAPVRLGEQLSVAPIPVPHRDELTETVAFLLKGPAASVLYVPDTDAWASWLEPIEAWLERVDVAYLDGTFHDEREVPERARAEIAHPTMRDTMARLASVSPALRERVRFLHLNHSNPCHEARSAEAAAVRASGYRLAIQGERVSL